MDGALAACLKQKGMG